MPLEGTGFNPSSSYPNLFFYKIILIIVYIIKKISEKIL